MSCPKAKTNLNNSNVFFDQKNGFNFSSFSLGCITNQVRLFSMPSFGHYKNTDMGEEEDYYIR